MSSRRILLFGNPDSIFVKCFIESVLLDKGIEVFLTCNRLSHFIYEDFYVENDVKFIELYAGKKFFFRAPYIGEPIQFYYNIKRICRNNKFDSMIIHYMGNNRTLYFLGKFINRIAKSVVCVFWGTDILGTDKKYIKLLSPILDNAQYINLSTVEMRSKFKEIFNEKYDNKISSCLFGNAIIQYIDLILDKKNIENCREKYKIPSGSKVISIGYNSSERQQHLKVLAEIEKLDEEVKEKICLLFHFGYGHGSKLYCDSVIDFAKKTGCEVIVIEKFLDEKEMAEIRLITDVFVHAQISDALSSSLLEYLYSGTWVINPTWIKYNEWEEVGMDYVKYNTFGELTGILEKVLKSNILERKIHNREIINNNYSWEVVAKKWKNLLNDNCDNGGEK